MTTVTSATASTTNALSILAQTSSSVSQLSVTRETANIDTQIQNRLNTAIAALQPTTDNAESDALQAQLTGLQTQQSTVQALAPQYGANANMLSSLQTQLGALQTAAAGGNSAAFDAALASANIDLSDLTVTSPPAPFQADGIAGLKGAGLGISSSATYDLGSPSGQAAAQADINAAQAKVGQAFAVTGANQLLAGDLTTSLTTAIGQLNTQQQQQDASAQAATQAQITTLTNQAQAQEHLIELALGNTTTLANSIFQSENPPTTVTSPLQALESAVGATAASSTAANNANPAILSLLA